MSFETDLAKFIQPYERLLIKIAEFINPLVISEFKNSKVEFPKIYDFVGEKYKKELEQRRTDFLKELNELPVPPDAKINFYQIPSQYLVFCKDFLFDEMFYDFGKLKVSHINEALRPVIFVTFPGSVLDPDATFRFDPLIPAWSYEKSKLANEILKIRESAECYIEHNVSEKISFWSTKALKEKNDPLIKAYCNDNRALCESGHRAVDSIDFKIKDIGRGEIDAFLKYVGLTK